jgi:superoxide dismutase, Fe-Mn family
MKTINRREFVNKTLKGSALAVAGSSFLFNSESAFGASTANSAFQFSQVALPYANNALEPNIDSLTMEIHYGKHHAAYI